jgi:hypothetical protein
MQSYIENMAVALNMENAEAHPVPFASEITNFKVCSESERWKSVGMPGSAVLWVW